MICPKCGAANTATSWRCKSCYGLLKDIRQQTDTRTNFSQSSFRQGREPNLTPVDGYESDAQTSSSAEGYSTEGRTIRLDWAEVESHRVNGAYAEPVSTSFLTRINRPLMIIAVAMLTLAAGLYAFFTTDKDYESANNLYALAEQNFERNEYSSALVLYQQIVDQHGDSELSGLAQDKMRIINERIVASDMALQSKERDIEQLLVQARAAYEKQYFLIPTDNNVIFYTRKILELDPTQPDALELQALVVNFYEDKAETAMNARRYNTAIRYYRNIMKIMPDNEYIENRIELAEKRRR